MRAISCYNAPLMTFALLWEVALSFVVRNLRAACCLAAVCVAVCLCVVPALAYADGSSIAASSEVVTVEAKAAGLNSAGWSATVSYRKPAAGEPTEFTITADGGPNGSGSYQYQQGFIYRLDPKVWVYDPTFGSGEPYRDSNVLSYEFVGAGRYEYQFQVRDAKTNLFQRFSFEVDVSGEGFIDTDAKAREIVAECLPDGNQDDYETALVLHDWIIDHVSYDYSFKHMGLDRALAGMAVTCEGYHAAYVKLLETAGMETGRVEGTGHVWTAVKMDGEWYHVDTTHDDVKDDLSDEVIPGVLTKDQQAHLLFGLNDEIMSLVDSGYDAQAAGYNAQSLENNYFIRTGDILEWADPLASEILKGLEQKQTHFTVGTTNSNWAQKSYKDVINNVAAYEVNQYQWTTDSDSSDAVVLVDYVDDAFVVDMFTVLSAHPVAAQGLVYSGKTQTGVVLPWTDRFAVSGSVTAVKAGTHTAQVLPADGYAWDASGDKSARSYQWTIAPASIASSAVTVSNVNTSYSYTGSAVTPVPSVKFGGMTLANGIDYTVSYANNVNAGTATMTIVGRGNFQGTRKVTFSIKQEAPRNTWKMIGGKTYYYGADSNPVKWGQWIDGSFYYFDGNGVMQTGWVTWNADGLKSYFSPKTGSDGIVRAPALTGWREFSGKWYYFNPNTGKSVRWGQKIGDNFFYFNEASVMQTGWITWNADGAKSYFQPGSGRALKGWQQMGGKWYYFNPSTGKTLRWGQWINGNFFYFDAASVMQTGWITWNADGRKSYFQAGSGRALLGSHKIDGEWYYFDPLTGKTR